MRTLLLLACLLLPACANTVKIDSVRSNSFDSVPELALPAVEVAELPATLPSAVTAYTPEGKRVSGFTPEGVKQLLMLKHAAETNTELLRNSLAAQEATLVERNLLLEAAKLEQRRANFYAEKWAVTNNELESERVRYTIMDTTYKVLIGLGLLVLIP